jgi:serine/threonine protein kinase/Tol biopolymer transport system component
MSITAGSRIGAYEVTAPLGQGGMGVVYRARDTELQRQVALKLLPDHFASDPDRLNRFEREAQVLASLNHPNIAQIYGLEKSGNVRCIVMELVEGETLGDRLKRGPLPLEEAIDMARQIAEALEVAHERQIVHRDLKPGNIKVAPDGKLKVLDFGLAKVSSQPGGANASPASEGFSNSPTLMSGSVGVILGTAPYMSPEQARGKSIDARTDIWAFGCVLYEMLTGRQTFSGETTTDVLAKVLEGQPAWDALPADTPSSIRMLLQSCLSKNPKQRLQHIGDARLFLELPPALDRSQTVVIRDRNSRSAVLIAIVLFVAFAAAAVPASLYFLRPPAELPVIRFEMPAPGLLGSPVISPDGQKVAYIAANAGKPMIWIRSLGSLSAQPLAGTDNAVAPFWAPDSRRLAFFADGKLKKADISVGGVQNLTDSPITVPGDWNHDGVILFTGVSKRGPAIFRISESGGDAVPVAGDICEAKLCIFPRFLPDGDHFLLHTTDGQNGDVYVASLKSTTSSRVMAIPNLRPGGNSPVMYAQGHLLFSVDRTLLAATFDPRSGVLGTDRTAVADNVSEVFSVSENGVLVYRAGSGPLPDLTANRLLWFDRRGKPAGEMSIPAGVDIFRLSPDGRIAMSNGGGTSSDVWIIDARGVPNKLTADNPGLDDYPVWSPDGTHIVFGSTREQKGLQSHLYQKSSSGVGTAELLLPGDVTDIDFPQDWSPAGILFERLKISALGILDVWVLSLPDRKASLYLHNGFLNSQAQFSPDGHYVAYTTNEPGTYQIVVRTFPDPSGNQWVITAQGGAEPLWKRDGQELYYLAPDGKIMAVAVKTGSTFTAGPPTPLFQTTLPRRRHLSGADMLFLRTVSDFFSHPRPLLLPTQPIRFLLPRSSTGRPHSGKNDFSESSDGWLIPCTHQNAVIA